jgi:hypothetical protein
MITYLQNKYEADLTCLNLQQLKDAQLLFTYMNSCDGCFETQETLQIMRVMQDVMDLPSVISKVPKYGSG